MPALPASAPSAEPRHIRGGAGGARRGQWVKYPRRIVFDADSYAPVDTNFYGKTNALAQRGLATASMEKIAGFLGISKSTAERSARRLGRPAGPDEVTEVFTRRKTHKVTGTGQTADRWCRPVPRGEAQVSAPVLAADTLRGILHRLYLALRCAEADGHQPTLAELAQVLRHHGGRHAGQPLAEATASRLLDELEGLGWITVDHRAGYRGRHLITVHDHPIHEAGPAQASPDAGDGSGPDLEDGSLASKEDHTLNDQAKNTQAGCVVRRRRGDRTGPRPVDTAGNRVPDTFGPGGLALRAAGNHPTPGPTPTSPTGTQPDTARRTAATPPGGASGYTGPGLRLSGRVWRVLAPVAHLLPGIRPYVLREIGREIGRQLEAGCDPGRLHDRIQRRYATNLQELPDPGRWILGAALPRYGCGLDVCESGRIWHTGQHCQTCLDNALHDQQAPPPPGPAPPVLAAAPAWHDCTQCDAPSRTPLPEGICRRCRNHDQHEDQHERRTA
jgi:hypothetical protein